MSKEPIRTERSHGLKERLDPGERSSLMQIRNMPGYEVLLDLMEKACIEQETRLINVDVAATDRIIAEHRMAKAFWQVFTSLQAKVETELQIHLGLIAEAEALAQQEADWDPSQQVLRP